MLVPCFSVCFSLSLALGNYFIRSPCVSLYFLEGVDGCSMGVQAHWYFNSEIMKSWECPGVPVCSWLAAGSPWALAWQHADPREMLQEVVPSLFFFACGFESQTGQE